ncbi:MAG: hypothetical protein IKS96_07535 [Fibrobacter sp.]|nr:hypothetical protein [Fibrobacter sp.]
MTLVEELVAFIELLELFFCPLELEIGFTELLLDLVEELLVILADELLDFIELLDALLLEPDIFFSVLLLDFSWLSPLKMTEEEDLLDEEKVVCFCACSHSSKSSSIFCT